MDFRMLYGEKGKAVDIHWFTDQIEIAQQLISWTKAVL